MKKRMLLFVLLLSVIAFSDVPYDSVYPEANTSQNFTRYHDFPLDNIHILRLQDASMALGRNVSVLHDQLAEYQTHQTNQISGMQASIDALQRTMSVRVEALQDTIKELEQPIPVKTTPRHFYLLVLSNIILFGIVMLLLFLIHRKPLPSDHTHPCPQELVHYIHNSRKNVHELRLELVSKGWTPVLIENAIKNARR